MAQSFNIPGPVDEAIGRKKNQLVRYIKGKQKKVGQNAPVRGTGNRPPRYYNK